ncbi:somatostatin receptor type 5-like [Saccoglossus kowalevskii]
MNGIVIFIILRYPGMRSIPNYYILNLAVADALFLLGLPFLIYFNFSKNWVFGTCLCKIVLSLDVMNMMTGIFTLTAMAVDRYVAVVHTAWSKSKRTVQHTQLVCVVLWAVSFVSTTPLWLYSTLQQFNGHIVCNVMMPLTVQYVFLIYTFIIGFGIPLIIIFICYLRITVYLQRIIKTVCTRRKTKIEKVSIMVVMAVLLFSVCWLPFWITRIVSLKHPLLYKQKQFQFAYYFTSFLNYINSALNPLVYAYFKHDFANKFPTLTVKCAEKKTTMNNKHKTTLELHYL